MRVCRLSLAILIAGLLLCMAACAFSTAEPAPNGFRDEDIGYAYFKGYSQTDIAKDMEGQYYVKNQILLSAEKNLTYKDVSEIASQYNAEIVGYLEIANDYQIEVRKNVTADDLSRIISELEKNPGITDASLNTISNSLDMRMNENEPAVEVYYEAQEPAISLDGYVPYAILYLTYGTDFDNRYGDVSGVILYADGHTLRYECPSDLEATPYNEDQLVSAPESLAKVTALQSPSTKTVDNIFSQLKDIDANSVTKVSEEIPSSGGVIPERSTANYILFAYYVQSDGEYQRLMLDSKGLFVSNLVDSNAKKICTWFYEQQSAWGFEVFTKIYL